MLHRNIRTTLLALGFFLISIVNFSNFVSSHEFTSDNVEKYVNSTLSKAVNEMSAKNGALFVMFYSDSCRHCREAFPEVDRLANAYKDDGDILKIGAVDAYNDPAASSLYKIRFFPTFYIIKGPNETDRIIYDNRGSHTTPNLMSFIQDHVRVSRGVDGNIAPTYSYTPNDDNIAKSLAIALSKKDTTLLNSVIDKINDHLKELDSSKNSPESLSILSKIATNQLKNINSSSYDPLSTLNQSKTSINNLIQMETTSKSNSPLLDWKNKKMLLYVIDRIITHLSNDVSSSDEPVSSNSVTNDKNVHHKISNLDIDI